MTEKFQKSYWSGAGMSAAFSIGYFSIFIQDSIFLAPGLVRRLAILQRRLLDKVPEHKMSGAVL